MICRYSPLPQVGFLRGNVREFFLLDQIPDKKYMTQNFNLQHPQAMLILGCKNPSIVDKIMKEKGIIFKNYEKPPIPDTNKIVEMTCDVQGTIDQILMRAIAKISFNYLAYLQGSDFVLHQDFNIIRNFILKGKKPNYPLVRMVQSSILGDEPIERKRRTGHIVTVSWADDGVSIIGQVSLMNWMKYVISLSRNFSGEHRDIKKGHFFNFPNQMIFPLSNTPQ